MAVCEPQAEADSARMDRLKELLTRSWQRQLLEQNAR